MEKEVCEECSSEDYLHNVIHEGRIAKLCHTCAMMNGAILIDKPTIDQINKSAKAGSLHEQVKMWRGEHPDYSEQFASLDTLRDKKHALEKEKQEILDGKKPKQEEKKVNFSDFDEFKKNIRELKIQDLRRVHHREARMPRVPLPPGGPQPLPEPPMPPINKLDNEFEMSAFMDEVTRIKEEEILEQELIVPRPLEPIDMEQIEEETEEKKDGDNNEWEETE